ncbi:Methyltransferase FkbM [Fulvivirga imtechensis AK7]|uniref:Methyltransferase FkbM n=2 Tax=Fulvivirga TaxID=396811 RepID=L8JVU8_9BACT|nr:Methyltransferase FkbM [Fulvivirga imtechensis AK7]
MPHEEDFNALSLLKFKKDALFIDIGANRGEAIQSILIKYPHNCKIIGFEPNPIIFKKLNALYKNTNTVTLHNTGLGNTAHKINLFIPFYRNWMFDGLASFYHKEAAEWLKSRLWNYEEKHLTIKEITCGIKRLDEYNLSPDFIKIDVQGYELEVLKGAQNTIAQSRPVLLLETPGRTVTSFLGDLGYNFYAYYNGRFNKGKGALNTFCFPAGKYSQLIDSSKYLNYN